MLLKQLVMTGTRLDISQSKDIVYALLACINMYRLVVALLPRAAVLERRVPMLCPIKRQFDTFIVHKPNSVVKLIYGAQAFFKRFGTSFEVVKVGPLSSTLLLLVLNRFYLLCRPHTRPLGPQPSWCIPRSRPI